MTDLKLGNLELDERIRMIYGFTMFKWWMSRYEAPKLGALQCSKWSRGTHPALEPSYHKYSAPVDLTPRAYNFRNQVTACVWSNYKQGNTISQKTPSCGIGTPSPARSYSELVWRRVALRLDFNFRNANHKTRSVLIQKNELQGPIQTAISQRQEPNDNDLEGQKLEAGDAENTDNRDGTTTSRWAMATRGKVQARQRCECKLDGESTVVSGSSVKDLEGSTVKDLEGSTMKRASLPLVHRLHRAATREGTRRLARPLPSPVHGVNPLLQRQGVHADRLLLLKDYQSVGTYEGGSRRSVGEGAHRVGIARKKQGGKGGEIQEDREKRTYPEDVPTLAPPSKQAKVCFERRTAGGASVVATMIPQGVCQTRRGPVPPDRTEAAVRVVPGDRGDAHDEHAEEYRFPGGAGDADYVRQIRAKEIDIYFGNLPLLIDLGCANPREMIDRERKISLLATTTISCDRPDAFPTRQMTLNVDDATHAADVELIDSLPVRALDQFRDHLAVFNDRLRQHKKVRETNELTQYSQGVATQIADLKETRRQALAQEKELREQLKTAKVPAGGSSTKRGQNTNASRSVIVSASSTRRVKTVPAIAASPSAILSIDDLNDSLLQPDIAPPPGAILSKLPRLLCNSFLSDLAPLDAMPAVQDASQWQMSDWEREFAALAEPSFSEPAFWAPYEPTMSSLYETAPYIPNYLGAGDLNRSVAAETSAHMVLYPDMPMFSGSDPTTLDELLSLNSSLLGASIDGPSGSFGDSLGGGDNIQNQLPALRAPPSPSESGSPAHAKRYRDQVDESNIISSIRVQTRSAKLQQSKVDPAPKKRPKHSKAHGSGYIVIKHL
ncbi:hypothetical protein K438DRAFT_1755433 [Mycena galopus ATCC 62051]|nr:hypothetical protein K438DRAFT_1755433 [Mycena galopus ATCC 62051]